VRRIGRGLVAGLFCGAVSAVELFLGGGTVDPADGWSPDQGMALLEELVFEHAGETIPLLVQFSGPVRSEWKAALEAAGAQIEGYVPDFAFLTRVPVGQLAAVAQVEGLDWLGEYRPGFKISPAVLERFAETNLLEVTLITFTPDQTAAVSNAVTVAGGHVTMVTASTDAGQVRAELDAAAVSNLVLRTEVQWVERYVPFKIRNDVAAQQFMNVTNIWNAYGLTGAGQIIGHADTGLDIGSTSGMHPDFTGRVLKAYALGRSGDWSDPDGHGTHTAGSILGDGSASGGQFKGLAYEAQLVHQSLEDSGGGLGGIPADLHDLFYPTYQDGARIHSDSWGAAVAGEYNSRARQADLFMWNYPDMLLCFAAGNSGVDDYPSIIYIFPPSVDKGNGVIDPDSIGAPGTAKNVLTVGASENLRAAITATYGAFNMNFLGLTLFDSYPKDPIKTDRIAAPNDGVHQGMAAFSSRGPTDDGRIKPDIVAPGTFVVSCRSRQSGAGTGWGVYNNDYVYMGGTSMSCPLTAGAAALVRQCYTDHKGIANPSAALIKATLINGAESLWPGQYGTEAFQEIPDGPRGNNVEGWGQVSLERSLYPTNAVPSRRLVFYDQKEGLETGWTNVHQVVVTGANELRITLAYTDFPGTLGGAKMLVNDLDLTVEPPSGGALYSRGLAGPDRTNNVENLDVAAPGDGVWTVRVGGYNVPSGPQPYALVISGDFPQAAKVLTVQGASAGRGGVAPAYGTYLLDVGTVTNVTAQISAVAGGVNHYFTGFLLDGIRQADADNAALDSLDSLTLDADRTVTVEYAAWNAGSGGDGVADWWKLRYYGAVDSVTAEDDSDGDGRTALQEYYALTDPHDADDFFRLENLEAGPDGVSFSFPAKARRLYTVQKRSSLAAGEWGTFSSRAGAGAPVTVTDESVEPTVFYRVKVELNEE